MFPGRKVPLLCRALLSRTLPPAGGADSLLCRLRVLPAVSLSDCPGGGSREDAPGAQNGTGAPGSARIRLLRKAWGRSLSPLDRVSRMIPPELISKEVQDLRGPELSSPAGEGPLDQVTPPPSSSENTFHVGLEDIGASAPLLGREVQDLQRPELSIPPGKEPLHQVAPPPLSLGSTFDVELEDVGAPGPLWGKEVSGELGNLAPPHGEEATEKTSPPHPPTLPPSPTSLPTPEADGDLSPPQGVPFSPGDILVAEYKRKYHSMFKKMFLLKTHGKLISNWGAISNQDIMGKLPGERLQTSTGHRILLRRPSLEEYVSFMKRGPNIAYPKDMIAMMMVMDVSPGDVVLEAGSGSGAFSLFLSRAVGSDGAVYSFEVRADHHEVAKRNFSNWRRAWTIRSGRMWPDNVRFVNKSVTDAFPDIKSVAFDAAVLDMLNPQVALPVITRNLKAGAMCAVYIANVTQVIDLLEGIRCCKLPLMCEKIIEVGVTDWLVAPSVSKDGKRSKRVEPQTREQLPPEEEEDDDDETDESDECPAGPEAFGQVPYIARPLPWQKGHTAFLVHLRKLNPTPPTNPEDSS